MICAVRNEKLVESGTHVELLASRTICIRHKHGNSCAEGFFPLNRSKIRFSLLELIEDKNIHVSCSKTVYLY